MRTPGHFHSFFSSSEENLFYYILQVCSTGVAPHFVLRHVFAGFCTCGVNNTVLYGCFFLQFLKPLKTTCGLNEGLRLSSARKSNILCGSDFKHKL